MIKEAIERLQHPTAIEGTLMLIVAVIGLAANIIGTMLLKPGSQDNLNLRAAYFHLLSDSIASVAIMIGAAGIIYFNMYWIDPVLTIGISLYIVREAYSIVKEAADVVMMSSPASIDIQEVRSVIEAISGVKNIHHVHIWKLNDADTHFEAHIEVENISTQEATEIQKLIERELHARYDIHHTTLQFECNKCMQQDIV
jgi:cobalt-zinc-cadmium efflux system protein